MTSLFKSSPYRRRRDDVEAGGSRSTDFDSADGDSSGTFDIPSTKNASIDRLRRWRQAALVLNASRRFRYTLDLKKEEEKQQILRKIRAHAQAIRAAYLFKEAGNRGNGTIKLPIPPPPNGDFGISQDQLSTITRDRNHHVLEENGGVKGVASALKSNTEKGIYGDDADLLKRKNAFGSNTYPQKKGRSFWVTSFANLYLNVPLGSLARSYFNHIDDSCSGVFGSGHKDRASDNMILASWKRINLSFPSAYIYIAIICTKNKDGIGAWKYWKIATEFTWFLGCELHGIKEGWYDGASIAFAVILVIVVTAISDYKQSLQFQNLNEEKRNIHLEVIRGGRRIEVSIYDIVVGDVIPLNIGDQVHKNSREPFLMSGCKVADGSGTMLVTGVGINTEWGLLMASISEDTGEETPLQVRLNGVATFIGIVGLTVALLVLIVLLVRYFTGHTKDFDGTPQFKAGKTKASTAVDGAIKILTVAVTIVVVAVPEGLPLAVTLTLAYSMRKMMMDKALVRRLSACETMGSATTICSDKTGTLTLNQMTIVEAYSGGQKIDPPDSKSQLPPILYSLLIEGIAQNTTGSVFVPEGGGDLEISGSPTEKAILGWAVKLGMNFDAVRSESSIIHVFPFNSEKKKGGVALQLPDSQVHIHWKGAAEIVLASCTEYINASGNIVPLDQVKVSFFRNAIEDMAASSLRCVAIAYRTYDMDKVPADEQQKTQWALPQDDLVLLAIVGIKDPCRPGVRDAVRLCQNAGVKVFLLFKYAVEPYVIEGRVFRNYSDAEREKIAEKILLLWVNLIMDTLGALALATEPPTDHLMHRNPVGRRTVGDSRHHVGKVRISGYSEARVSPGGSGFLIWTSLLCLGYWMYTTSISFGLLREGTTNYKYHVEEPADTAYQVSVLLVLNFRGRSLLGLEHETPQRANNVKNTLIFNAFVFCQVIIIEFVGKFTSTVRLNWKQWLISAVIAFISWPLAAVGKLIPVPQTPLHKFFTRIFHRSARPPSDH
ncbi:hypothetical protein DKX38_009270 [Salix brachista]|uniref:Calcium-transporting ATPase n=1 Tax=Salix brachista TaxID=2182728 RepID=A0A5N5MAA7_9ROSI|nr:hypothetical protein DKX38_009270 [Salix brachista]